jgi:hypothetical protein
MPEPTFEELIDAMKDAVGVLQRAEIPFVLGGGLSAWARGGPRSEHDVDFLVRPDDAETALTAFEQEGWKTERPPEGLARQGMARKRLARRPDLQPCERPDHR